MAVNRHVKLDLERLKEIVKNVKSRSRAYKEYFGNKPTIDRTHWLIEKIESNNIDTSHWRHGLRGYKQDKLRIISNEELFCVSPKIKHYSTLRKRVLDDNLIPYKCAICNSLPLWQGNLLTLHLDHINGIRKDCRLENLRFLCPNCHQQTETWGTKSDKNFNFNIEELIEMAKTLSYKEIARRKKCSPSTISNSIKNELKRKELLKQLQDYVPGDIA